MPFVFSRRSIQSALDRLGGVFGAEQLAPLVSRLNRRKEGRLPAMWEAMVLAGFAGQPDFRHEDPLPNGRAPDFAFLLPETAVRVVGDIRTVSDAGSHDANPLTLLLTEIDRIAAKLRTDRTQFEVYVPGRETQPYSRRKVRLRLPPRQSLARFCRTELEPYMRERMRRGDYGHRQVIEDDDYRVELTFRPKSRFARFGHPSYTHVIHVDRNPIWAALKEKADQLREAPAGAVRVLVLCDGGCAGLQSTGTLGDISFRQIVETFLQRVSGLDLVVGLTVSDQPGAHRHPPRRLDAALFVSPAWARGRQDAATVLQELAGVLDQMATGLPQPVSNAASAAQNCRTMDYGIGFLGGYRMAGSRVSVSARTVQRLLAGDLSLQEFNDAHGWDPPTTKQNPFAAALREGRSIRDIRVRTSEAGDDDWLDITFADDPALCPFKSGQAPRAD